jgi:hypothetical protein
MSPNDRQQTEQLERDLRQARALFDDVDVSSDAWQQNQRRLAADRSRRGGRGMAVAAAVVAVVLLGALVASLADQGPNRGAAGSGGSGGDPWAPENILGEPQQVETVRLDGQDMAHELVLTDTDGSGPQLCDRFSAVESDAGAGGCTPRQPDADDSSVTFDWISGTTGSGDGLHAVVAGVDDRVMKVQVWMDNGDMTLAELHPTGWEGTRMLAFTARPGAPVPQRLVAYSDATGTVLQAVDLARLFGKGWLPGTEADCADVQQDPELRWPPQGDRPTVGVRASVTDVEVTHDLPDARARTVCLPMDKTASVVRVAEQWVVVVVAPEVAPTDDVRPVGTTMWRAGLWPVDPGDDTITFPDRSGNVLRKVQVPELP